VAPATLELASENGQILGAGRAVGVSPAVLARDASGSPVSGAVVTYRVTSGGGSLTGAQATTNAAGTATVGNGGYQYGCGVDGNGTASCWGYNGYGELGTGNNVSTTAAKAVGGG